MKPIISLISAMSINRMIGRDNQLPWHLPEDLKHFKALTMEKPMIMGRHTWESLPGLLPKRQHIVITRQLDYVADGCDVARDLSHALVLAGEVKEVMIVGGGQIYQQFLARADNLYITQVNTVQDGDTFFPEWDHAAWVMRSQTCLKADDRHVFDFCFEHYVRASA